MATGFPPIDPFNPLIQELRDQFEREHLSDGGYEGVEHLIRRSFIPSAARVYARALIADAFTSRWGLGDTQQELADELGIERSRISDAYRKGDLTFEGFLTLRFHPLHPDDWEPDENAINMCNRAGFLEVANALAERVTSRTFTPQILDPLHHELMCDLFRSAHKWGRARFESTHDIALEYLAELTSPSRDVTPFWYLREQRSEVEGLLNNLMRDAHEAFAYLCVFQDSWEDVFVAAYFAAEAFKWSR